MATQTAGELIWEDLERQLQVGREVEAGIWEDLKETSNISTYRPIQAPGVVHRRPESDRDGPYYMLNNPEAGTYLKLDPKDFYVWSLMDGTQPVKELVVAYFSQFGSIAFSRVTNLVAQLRTSSFLTDPPINVYSDVHAQSQKGTLSYWGERLVRTFLQKDVGFSGIDGILTRLYHGFFWIFFSKAALKLYPFLVVPGLVLFFYTVQVGDYPLLSTGGKWYWGILTFAVCNLIMVAVHESAHAFTTKHFGRKVRRGGVLVYFGSLAFFVDTMDVWMEPKKHRMAVSWAGPYSGLLLGSLCMFIIAGTGFADNLMNPLLFKMAIWAFVFGALTNLNPLLEWDGYFMLMDWLELPMLRKRSMDFVKRNLINKIATRASFSSEEKIFAVFGTMALIYTATVLVVAIFFWQSRVGGILKLVDGWVFWLLIGLIVAIIGVPVFLALGVFGYKWAQRTHRWAYRSFFMGSPANQVAGLFLAAVAAALPAFLLGDSISRDYSAVAGSVILGAGLLLSLRVAPWYLGSQLQWVYVGLPWVLGLLLAAQALSTLGGAAGTFSDVVRFAAGPIVLFLATAYLSPTILSFTKTALQGAWGLSTFGIAALAVSAIMAVATSADTGDKYAGAVALLAFAAIAGGLYRLQQRLRALRPEQHPGVIPEVTSDVERLGSAIQFVVESTMEQFAQIHGRRALRALEVQFNTGARVGASWAFSIHNGHITDTGVGALLERSQGYAAALSHFFSIKSSMAGNRFVDRQLRGLYRLMPWEAREIGEEYLFSRLDWMGGVRRAFAPTRGSHYSLLRSAPLFARLGEDEIKEISDRLQSERSQKGRDIISQGERGRKFYIIESGTVEVWVRHEGAREPVLEAELGRGDYFGERALLADEPRAATCRCKTRVQVLSLDRADFNALVARRFQLLRSTPLFAGLEEDAITVISDQLHSETHPSGRDIIIQGEPGDKFYLIESGTVEVWVRDDEDNETRVAELERGDYFGERALHSDIPRTATCRSKTSVRVLSLGKEDFDDLVARRFELTENLDEAMYRAELLSAMPLFAEVSPSHVKIIASKLEAGSHPGGTTIIRQGDIGDKFYLIESGTVSVRRHGEGTQEETVVGSLSQGEYFGEIALLMNVPRTASVVAETAVKLLSLDTVSFDEMVKEHLQSGHSLEQVSSRRLIQLRRTESVGYREES